jgi:RNA polymerase sigma-70 factor (ECF subfamily)
MADPSASTASGSDPDAVEAVEAAFRHEARRALATVVRLTGDLQLAEDAIADAHATALERWPAAGVPDRPGAWITTVARNRALDVLRREARRGDLERAATEALAGLEASPAVVQPVEDDQLQLLFTCCHPAFAPEVRVALALRFVCGLPVPEVARVLLVGDEAVAKRLQRAKAKLRAAVIPLGLPAPEQLAERVPSVLDCTYLLFTEGYAATGGDDWVRAELCDEAVRLARLLARSLPEEPGAAALAALVLLQDSRRSTRIDGEGRPVLLADQDRPRWDRARIDEGLRWLAAAHEHAEVSARAGSFLLQAAIAAEHARAASWASTDWSAIVSHYDHLLALSSSPVVALNRAIAVSFADGPAVARPLLEALAHDARLARSTGLRLALADVAARSGDRSAARLHLRAAAELAGTSAEQAHIGRRTAELDQADAAAE